MPDVPMMQNLQNWAIRKINSFDYEYSIRFILNKNQTKNAPKSKL
jgi:hypothetical protein